MQIEKTDLGKDGRLSSEAEYAKLLGVSSITVRKALNDLVNEGIIYRVRGKGSFVASNPEPAPERTFGYVTFIIAAGHEMYDSSHMQIIKGIQSYLSQQNCKLIIEFVENDFDQERELVGKLIQSDNCGLLIYSGNPNAAKGYLKELRNNAIPYVMIDRVPSGYSVDCITCNNYDGVYEAVQHLIANGHRNIGFAAFDFHLSSEIERYNGYRRAMFDAKLDASEALLFFQHDLDYAFLVDEIEKGNLTALFCANDRRALEVIDRLSAYGIVMPEQLSIMGFDDFENSKFAKVPLSTVKQNFEALGHEGAKLLFEMWKHPARIQKKIALSTELVLRDSIRKLDQNKRHG
ncbi:substrate-binding domain-containing protein [Paenibacillus sacheonensis]|uniref:Substrate-binding domain-containing protein n=2 Tax=Paenibacillus sacheonensis TaxID=742054 RepID=A0A7X5C040_9BACL|nr:substrate-binding domain-containing protein [Paenibacillus sacheonensis]